jgi:hypothetical protein
MTNTIDKVAAEPAEQEPAGAGYRRNRGASNVNVSVQRTIVKSPAPAGQTVLCYSPKG